jgi:hypothetical protein
MPMRAPNDTTAPPRTGLRRLITPWEYRHRRSVASVRFASGGFTLGVGLVLLSLGRQGEPGQERSKCFGFAALFLGLTPLQFFGGYLDMTADRAGSAEGR